MAILTHCKFCERSCVKQQDFPDTCGHEECIRRSLQSRVSELEELNEKLKLEAQIWKGEDNGHKSSLLECYQAVGAQKGDWNGAQPVIDYVKTLQEQLAELQDQLRWRKWPDEKPDKSGSYFCDVDGGQKVVLIYSFEYEQWFLETLARPRPQTIFNSWLPIPPIGEHS